MNKRATYLLLSSVWLASACHNTPCSQGNIPADESTVKTCHKEHMRLVSERFKKESTFRREP